MIKYLLLELEENLKKWLRCIMNVVIKYMKVS